MSDKRERILISLDPETLEMLDNLRGDYVSRSALITTLIHLGAGDPLYLKLYNSLFPTNPNGGQR